MLRVGIVGYFGRMGQLIAKCISQESDMALCSALIHTPTPSSLPQNILFTEDYQEFLHHCDCVIDFSNPSGTLGLLQALLKSPKPAVIGTTGLDDQSKTLLEKLSCISPIVYASNTSEGMALLNQLVALLAQALPQADIEITEFHHNQKKDSPSGSAMSLAQSCAKARGWDLESVRVSGRDGNIGKRSDKEIGVMSLRGGDIVGKHTVGFYCDGEYLELTHNATNRNTFALGALKALKWVINQKNGLYNMQDVLRV